MAVYIRVLFRRVEKDHDGYFNVMICLKCGHGGVIDIEFLVIRLALYSRYKILYLNTNKVKRLVLNKTII